MFVFVMSELKGKLKITRYGFGIILTNTTKTIKVDRKDLNNNFNGDEVNYIILKDTGKTQFAKITSEPKYKNREFIGIVHHTYKEDAFVYNFNIGKSNLVLCDKMIIDKKKKKNIATKLGNNNFVKFTIKKYRNNLFYGRVIDDFGPFESNEGLSKYMIDFYNLNNEFPKKVIQKSEKVRRRYENDFEKEVEIRKDLRNINTFTIDPQGARDLDDAISLEKENDTYKLYIHIADVSYFVKKGNSIDIESRKRSFSVYLPNQVIRMLPPILSENLCSLLPDSDKLAVTTEVNIDNKGNVLNWVTYKSVIRSNYKYSYEEVFDILENKKNNKYFQELNLLHELSEKLKYKRLKLPNRNLNDNFDTETYYSDYSHSMIEEMMILNNILVAKTLFKKGVSYPARYHGEPELKNSTNLLELVEKTNSTSINKLDVYQLQNIIDSSDNESKLINLYFIQRILCKAIYDNESSGHWALNLDFYSHFTSPIRRYPDLISHRLIFEETYKDSTLKKYLKDINQNEKDYQQIEFFLDKVKLIRHLNKLEKKNNNKIFKGYIIDIKNPTITVFIPNLFWTDEFHIADITNNKMNYDDNLKLYKLDDLIISNGMAIELKIKKIKVAFLDIDFEVNKL